MSVYWTTGRLVAVRDGVVCSTLVGAHLGADGWVGEHHLHGCVVSTVPADEHLPTPGDRWTPPGQREDVS